MAEPTVVALSADEIDKVVTAAVAKETEALRAEVARLHSTTAEHGELWGNLQAGQGRKGVRKLYKQPEWSDPLFDLGMTVRVKDNNEKKVLCGKLAKVTDAPHYHTDSRRWKYRLRFAKGVLGGAGTKERMYEEELERE